MSAPNVTAEQGVAAALATFARDVRERFGDSVVDLRLFGSFARSTAHEESDVDVAEVIRDTRIRLAAASTEIARCTRDGCGHEPELAGSSRGAGFVVR